MVRRGIYVALCLFLCSLLNAENRYALTVFISEYPEESGWNHINSSNDKKVIIPMLNKLGYKNSNIICLDDEGATYSNIINAFESLAAKASKGDKIYVHFSCHGQQITDLNGDESSVNPKDKYDEALVPYDAYVAYGWNGYKGQNHLLDDTLYEWLNTISSKVGKDGSLIFIADACHSGDLKRTKEDNKYAGYRGTFDRFELPLQKVKKSDTREEVSWTSISACKDFQTNFECEYEGVRYGRLSLAVSRCMNPGMNVSELIAALKEEYAKMPLPKGKAQTLEVDSPKNALQRVL